MKGSIDYPAWITAAAAVVQTVAAVVLYKVTKRTLTVNEELARVAGDQLVHEQKRDAERRQRSIKGLVAVADRLLRLVTELPSGPADSADKKLRQAITWSQADITATERLALDVDILDAEEAAQARLQLQFLLEQVRRVQSTDKNIGFKYEEFPWERFSADRASLISALAVLQSLSDE